MSDEKTFSYTYSASEKQEVLDIRRKYLPREESKLEELKRLDRMVQDAGVMEGLITGIGGCLVFGLGLCLAMKVIGNLVWLGVLLGLAGAICMGFAYPVNRKRFRQAKEQHTPRILELAAELSGQNS